MTRPFVPGPWLAYPRKDDKHPMVIGGEYAAEGEPDLMIDVYVVDDEQEGATLRLISHAPELYEALDALCKASGDPYVTVNEMGALWDNAERLLRRTQDGKKPTA